MSLGQVAFDLQAVLFVVVLGFIQCHCLLCLDLEQLLDSTLYNLATLFHATGKGSKLLIQLRFHLLGNVLVGFPYGFDLGSDNIERHAQSSLFRGAKRFSAEVEQLAGIFLLDSGACWKVVNGGIPFGPLLSRTSIERFQFVASGFGIVHALEQWRDACILLAPEIVCNFVSRLA